MYNTAGLIQPELCYLSRSLVTFPVFEPLPAFCQIGPLFIQ